MKEETILGLPKVIDNSDDEPMGICISYDPDDKVWSINYADEGSCCYAEGKTLEQAIERIKKEYKKLYGFNL